MERNRFFTVTAGAVNNAALKAFMPTEKEVQRKMDELTIQPSDSVWPNVKTRIEKNKKSRGLFLLVFLFAFIFIPGAYWLWNVRQYGVPVEADLAKNVSKNKHDVTTIPSNHNNPRLRVNPDLKKMTSQHYGKIIAKNDSQLNLPTRFSFSFQKWVKLKITSNRGTVFTQPGDKDKK